MVNPTIFEQHNQSHLLSYLARASGAEQQRLLQQMEQLDLPQLSKLLKNEDQAIDWAELSSRAEPPPAIGLADSDPIYSKESAIVAGEAAIRSGRVAMILVAGGQGTRLGFDLPKGMFAIGPVSGRTLFQMHCDRLKAVMARYHVSIPMFVMTSPATDEATRQYFAENDRCGLSEEQLQIFCQGSMPAVDAKTGKILVASEDSLALSPDGHGGLVAALDKGNCLKLAASLGIDYFYYAQVDNPLAQLCDPELIGYHILDQSQMTTQVVQKRFATEKVGNVVSVDGRVQIIEYSDLPESAAQQTNPDGTLKLWAGNIAVHVFDRSFLEQVVDSADGLPFHRAHKKVPYLNSEGNLVEPDSPNAIKFERFVFDLLPLASRAFVVEGNPADVFAPVKNANGAEVDTPAHSQRAMLAMYRRWLEAAGCTFAEGVAVEIHPGWALDAQAVQSKLPKPVHFAADTFLM